MYTNLDRLTASITCEGLWGKTFFDELIVEAEGKNRRLYGPEIPKEQRKPKPDGWGKLVENMGLVPDNSSIMEDRLNVIENALRHFDFRYAILVMAPTNHTSQEHYKTSLQETRERLNRWDGAPIIMVRDLSHIRTLLTSDSE